MASTVSSGASGIGGGIIANGRLLTGAGGYAGELGHTFVRTDGQMCHCAALGQVPLVHPAGGLDALLGLAVSLQKQFKAQLVGQL
jgi:predicted NBD/HSP70 family sugar kinase